MDEDPEYWQPDHHALDALPADDPVTPYRQAVLEKAVGNVRMLLSPPYQPPVRSGYVDLPAVWIEKCKKVILVMEPETMGGEPEAACLIALIKLGLLEIPLSRPIHHAPTTEFNPAVRLHNSLIRSSAIIRYGEQYLSSLDHDEMEKLRMDFPEGSYREEDVRRLAKALLRLVTELPALAAPSRMPRLLYLLHENARALTGFWTNTRIMVNDRPASHMSRIWLSLLKSRQAILEQVTGALTDTPFPCLM
jgi:hypothetical protein